MSSPGGRMDSRLIFERLLRRCRGWRKIVVFVCGIMHLDYKSLEPCRRFLNVNPDYNCLNLVNGRRKLVYDLVIQYDGVESHLLPHERL